MWEAFCRCIGHDLGYELAEQSFHAPLNGQMLRLAQRLRADSYKVGIITNNTRERFKVIRDDHDLDKIFYPIIVSGEVGHKKGSQQNPDAIFRIALKRLALSPGEAVFIDNNSRYLHAPRSIGINAIHHDDSKIDDISRIVAELERLGMY